MFRIYCIENKISKTKYIGKTKLSAQERFKQHIYSSRKEKSKLYSAFKSYGVDNFKCFVVHDNIKTDAEANSLESHYIKLFNTMNEGYNLTPGGDGGSTRSGMKNTPEHNKKISDAQKGKPKQNPGLCGKYEKSENHRKKISETIRGRKWVTNDTTSESLQVDPDKIQYYLEKGYRLGRSKTFANKLSKSNTFKGKDFLTPQQREELNLKNRNKIWICNPFESKMISKDDFEQYENLGYKRGRKF